MGSGLRGATFTRVGRKIAVFTIFLAVLSACESSDGNIGYTDINGYPGAYLPPGGPGSDQQTTAVGPTCVAQDQTKICLGLKYVVYQDSGGKAVASTTDALNDLTKMNQIWAQCGIAFQIEEFTPVDPTRSGLAFNTANIGDLDAIRNAYGESGRLLVVTTGAWNRSGTLGQTSANAWTAMPGGGPYGAILEAAVSTYGPIYAHELGHYLNLEHVSDASDVMNPVIYTTSAKLTASQCSTARSTALGYWSAMTRGL